jgi:hypothetical protein
MLHNIMRSIHPNLIEKAVETITPYQGNMVTLAAHVRNMSNHLENEALRKRYYTKYEGLMMVVDSLYGRCRERLKQKVELSFTTKHDRIDRVPFKLEMTDLGTTLTEWAEEMKVGVPQGTRDGVNHIDHGPANRSLPYEYPSEHINAIDSIQTCSVCGMGGHTLDYCHLTINAVKGQDFIKAHPDVARRIRKAHKKFFRHKPRPRGPHVHNIMDDPHGVDGPAIPEQDDRPALQFDADGYIYHLHDSSAEDNGSASEELSIHSDPFGGPMVQFIDADHTYDHNLEDLLVCDIQGDGDYENASTTSFSSAGDGPSSYEDAIDLLADEGTGMQDNDVLPEKGQPGTLLLP